MRYKVGDKVILRSDLVEGEMYGGINFIDSMTVCKPLKVCNVYEGCYFLEEDEKRGWFCSDEMIDHKTTEQLQNKEVNKMKEFKVGDEVKVVDVNGGKEIYVTSIMKRMLGEIFTIKNITFNGHYKVNENNYTWGASNLELVKDVFKVGDKVKVVDVNGYEIYTNKEMQGMLGEIFTIKSITFNGYYNVNENQWVWGASNLELVEESTKIRVYNIDNKLVTLSLQYIKENRVAIHCDTEEKADEFLSKLDKEGVTWCSGESVIGFSKYDTYGEATCYDLYYEDNNTLRYYNINYYSRNAYNIYKYAKDVEETDTTVSVWELEEGKEYREITEHTEVTKFRVYEGELEYSIGSSEWRKETHESSLQQILSYKFIEIEKPFPSIGDEYYYISLIGAVVSVHGFNDDNLDKLYIETNNVFRTEEEAEKKLEEIKKVLKGGL